MSGAGPAPLTLMLCAAEQRLMFGLSRDGVLICGQDFAAASQGAELLAHALRHAADVLGLDFSSIDRIACVNGPGSFTGVRLALATASGLHHSLGMPLCGISYLELLAASAPALEHESVRVITHARRDLVHWQNFQRTEQGVQALGEARVGSPHEAGADAPHGAVGSLIVTGSGVAKYADILQSLLPGARLYTSQFHQPDWQAFMGLAARAHYTMQDIEPVYLRASEAEDNLEMLAGRRGDDPHKARATLEKLLHKKPESLC